MAKKRKLRQELSKFAHKTEKPLELISGALGIYIGGKQYVDIPTRPGYVFVRLRNNMSELIQAHNQTVSPIYDLPVLVVWNHNRYEIYGRDSEQYGSYWDTSSSFLPKHGFQHEFDPDNNGGGDLVFVHGEQFYPMMTFPSGTDGANTVLIAPYRYFYQGLWRYTGNTGVGDLLALGPTGGNNAKLLLVGVTSATGNPFIKQGDEFSEGITGAAALTQFVPTSLTPIDEIPGAIIRLVTGTETITWANIYDARQYMGILQAGSGTGGGATNFLGLTDTPNSYSGQADKLVVVNAAENALEFRTSTGTSGGSHILNIVDDVGGLASGDNNDYAPTGYVATTDVIVVYGNADNTSRITGITGGVNGRKLTIINGTDNRVTIGSSGGGSSAGNTIETNSSEGISIRTYEAVSLIWYTSLGEWVIVDDHKIRNTFWIDSSVTGTVTANQNNWSLTVFDEKAVFLMSPTADRDITGISSVSGTKHGQVLTFININSSFTLTFKNESGSSAAENRFSMGADLAVGPGKSATFWYDKFAQRWRNTSSTVSGGTGGTTLGLGFYGQYEAVGLGTGTTLNVVGSDISLSISGTVLTLLHSDPTGTPYSFLDLTDTPDTYSGQGSKYVAVNSGGTALEFVTAPAGGGGGNLIIYDDGVFKATGTSISFDANLSVIASGTSVFVAGAAGGGGGGAGVMAWDEGVPLGTGTVFNFRGDNIVATISGTVVDIFVSGSVANTLNTLDPYGIHHRLSGFHADDDEFSVSSTGSYTSVVPTGNANWVGANGVLNCIFSGQSANDIACMLKAMTLADGEWFETTLRIFNKKLTNFCMGGIVLTDGTAVTSRAIALMCYLSATSGNLNIELWTGTVTNMLAASGAGYIADAGSLVGKVRLRLLRNSATSFALVVGMEDGAQYNSFGAAAINPGFTPTHAGLLASVWGGAQTSMISYDYIRHMS